MGGEAGRAPSGGLRSCACSRTGWGRHHHHHQSFDDDDDDDGGMSALMMMLKIMMMIMKKIRYMCIHINK